MPQPKNPFGHEAPGFNFSPRQLIKRFNRAVGGLVMATKPAPPPPDDDALLEAIRAGFPGEYIFSTFAPEQLTRLVNAKVIFYDAPGERFWLTKRADNVQR